MAITGIHGLQQGTYENLAQIAQSSQTGFQDGAENKKVNTCNAVAVALLSVKTDEASQSPTVDLERQTMEQRQLEKEKENQKIQFIIDRLQTDPVFMCRIREELDTLEFDGRRALEGEDIALLIKLLPHLLTHVANQASLNGVPVGQYVVTFLNTVQNKGQLPSLFHFYYNERYKTSEIYRTRGCYSDPILKSATLKKWMQDYHYAPSPWKSGEMSCISLDYRLDYSPLVKAELHESDKTETADNASKVPAAPIDNAPKVPAAPIDNAPKVPAAPTDFRVKLEAKKNQDVAKLLDDSVFMDNIRKELCFLELDGVRVLNEEDISVLMDLFPHLLDYIADQTFLNGKTAFENYVRDFFEHIQNREHLTSLFHFYYNGIYTTGPESCEPLNNPILKSKILNSWMEDYYYSPSPWKCERTVRTIAVVTRPLKYSQFVKAELHKSMIQKKEHKFESFEF